MQSIRCLHLVLFAFCFVKSLGRQRRMATPYRTTNGRLICVVFAAPLHTHTHTHTKKMDVSKRVITQNAKKPIDYPKNIKAVIQAAAAHKSLFVGLAQSFVLHAHKQKCSSFSSSQRGLPVSVLHLTSDSIRSRPTELNGQHLRTLTPSVLYIRVACSLWPLSRMGERRTPTNVRLSSRSRRVETHGA